MESKEERLKKIEKWKKQRRGERNKEAPLKPEETYLASGGLDRSLRVWKVPQGEEVKKLKTHQIYALDWHPTENKVVTGTDKKTVEIWDLERGERVNKLQGHVSFVNSVKWDPKGKRIASTAGDASARIWNTLEGEIALLKGHEDYMITDLVWMNEKKVITSAMDKSVKVWIIKREKEKNTLQIKKKKGILSKETLNPTSLAWNKRMRYLAVGTMEGDIHILDTNWNVFEKINNAHEAAVSSIQFNTQGNFLLSGSYDGFTKVWKVTKGKFDSEGEKKVLERKLKMHGDSIYKVIWSIDGKWASSSGRDSTIVVWETEGWKGTVIGRHRSAVLSFAIRPPK